MKLAMPVDDKNMDTTVCISFGRAPFFLIYDMDTKESTFILNEAADASGGAGIKAAQTIVDSGAEALISPRCGENAANVIDAGEIKMYKSNGSSIQENIKAFEADSLVKLNDIHPGFHGHGGN